MSPTLDSPQSRRSSSSSSSHTLSPSLPSPSSPQKITTTTTPHDVLKAAYASWKREPTTADVLFGLALPYRPPRSWLGAFIWRRRVWLETTFALSMLENWEKGFLSCVPLFFFLFSFFFFSFPPTDTPLTVIVSYALFTLVLTATYLYLPHHILFLRERAAYYLLGQSPDPSFATTVVSATLTSPSANVNVIVETAAPSSGAAGVLEGMGRIMGGWASSAGATAGEL